MHWSIRKKKICYMHICTNVQILHNEQVGKVDIEPHCISSVIQHIRYKY